MPDRIYLDHAATTPLLPQARDAMLQGLARWANPSSPHAEGRAAKAALEDARARIAAAYGWRHEVLLTSGASESLTLAYRRAVAPHRIITAVEHDAVMRLAERSAVIPTDRDGEIDFEALQISLPSDQQALVCVQWANSETGVRQPIATIAAFVHSAGSLLLVDAAQMPAGADDEVAEFADFVALSAHKRGGPPGIGALLVRDLGTLSPTGGQERGYRPGTENLPAALGYAVALEVPEPLEEAERLRALLDDAIVRSGGEVIGEGWHRHPTIASYRMPGVASAVQLIRLDQAGFAVSAGSACASGTMKLSHVLNAIGVSDEARREVIRVSFGRSTTEDEVRTFIAAWRSIARETRSFAA